MAGKTEVAVIAEILRKYGIRYSIHRGELFIDSHDWVKYNKLCDEGELPESLC